ncbi:cation-translocating P-type ATPase [Salegentibacter sp. HM20]
MANRLYTFTGLNATQVEESRTKFGSNKLEFKEDTALLTALKNALKEPMILLLLAAATIYFILGEFGDGIFLSLAIILVATISVFQDFRSRRALSELKEISQGSARVIREGKEVSIPVDEIVIGDHILVEEGSLIPADALILQSNDFSVNEALLTGESLPVSKDVENAEIFRGSQVTGGLAIARVVAVGNKTKLGKIGKSIEDITAEPTNLEIQINDFIKKMVLAGSLIFILVWILNFLKSRDILESLLYALTLAMSILPEEIPVAFTTFMAMGAWRLMREGVIVKQIKTVESLGSAGIICTDKTGTLTKNKMSLAAIYTPENKVRKELKAVLENSEIELLTTAMWASEPVPFDPMEIALHDQYSRIAEKDRRGDFKMYFEYPLEGKPPMMTHIFENSEKDRIIAAKGAPEAILKLCKPGTALQQEIEQVLNSLAGKGYRILGVATSNFSEEEFPEKQQELPFEFCGLIAFYDPPKENIAEVLQQLYGAGIEVKIVTGDNELTTRAIAGQIGFKNAERHISGQQLVNLEESKVYEAASENYIFTRMYPEAKLKLINALKKHNGIVAMTGDGINDAPALKAAHIGIAMGKRGSEIAKNAASLILAEDDLGKMLTAVKLGRRIYTNLKKAIRYIISIHIPIILIVFLPLALGWIYPNIFSPIHIIFLELIMGPTCSIIFENEPAEKNILLKKPRPYQDTFFNNKELGVSILQGLVITAACLLVYQISVNSGGSEALTRTLVFSCLISANIFLTLVNRSFYFSAWESLRYKNRLIPLILGVTVFLLWLLLYVAPITEFFEFETPSAKYLSLALLAGFISVFWYELVKLFKRFSSKP